MFLSNLLDILIYHGKKNSEYEPIFTRVQLYVAFVTDVLSIKSNFIFQLYTYKHVIHDEIYILEKRMEKKLNNL